MDISDAVHISTLNAVAGDGAFAAKDLKAGDTIFALERPLIGVLDTEYLANACSNCFRTSTSPREYKSTDFNSFRIQTCAGCKTLRYCSKQCQSASWKRQHKSECKILQKVVSRGKLPNAARAVLLLLLRDAVLNGIESHLEDIARAGGERYASLQALSTGLLNFTGTKLGLGYTQQCFAMIQTNSFTLTSSTFDPIGVVFDPRAAKFNHSCNPNAFVVFDGAKMSLRSLKSISKNEEIFISYIDATNPYFRRQHELEERYFFQCKCSKCKLGSTQREDMFITDLDVISTKENKTVDVLGSLRTSLTSSGDNDCTERIESESISAILRTQEWLAFNKLEEARKSITTSAISENKLRLIPLKEGVVACLQTKVWPDIRQPLPALRQQLFVELLTNGFDGLSWSFAFRQGLKLYFDIHPILYPETFHPGRMIHKWTLANLALLLADPETRMADDLHKLDLGVVILGLLIEVQDNVRYSNGLRSTFAGVVHAKLEEVKVDMTRGDTTQLQNIKERIGHEWRLLRQIAHSKDLDTWMSYV